MRFKVSAVIPVVQYGNIQPEIELEGESFEELRSQAMGYIEGIWKDYGERPMKAPVNTDGFQRVKTFTGETVLYDDSAHKYTDEDGNALVSGSEFAHKNEKPFDSDMISGLVSKKYGVAKSSILDMWNRNSEISTTFGTSLHLAMEQWFRNKNNGTEKEYHLPKPGFLKAAVASFPLKNETIHPEVFISDIKNKMCGQIDGLVEYEGSYAIIDYKTDNDVKKNLSKHGRQLNFYRTALENKGFSVNKMAIWNYAETENGYEWKEYSINREETVGFEEARGEEIKYEPV